jgi:hypothetical protein
MPYHLQVLHELLAIEIDLTRLMQKQAHAEVEIAARLGEPAPDFTVAADRMGRTVRRTVMLIEKLLKPVKEAAERKEAARKRVVRAVENSIERDAPDEDVERLQAEFQDRMDRPDIEDDFGDRPVEEIIAEIRQDLGIAAAQIGGRPWKRRTPGDVALLCKRAATKRPAAGPFVLPMPPRGWVYDNPLFKTGDAAGCRGP